jgi:putative transposase
MTYDPEKHNRKSLRLKHYDYTKRGEYFITICTENKKFLFGDVVNAKMHLNDFGRIAARCWLEIPIHFEKVDLDVFVAMPNHVHGILALNYPDKEIKVINGRGTACCAQKRSFGSAIPGALSTIIRSYKSAVSKEINNLLKTPGNKIWQRNYYDHIIRFDNEFWDIHYYIVRNPEDWEKDMYNPNFHGGYDRKSWEPDE